VKANTQAANAFNIVAPFGLGLRAVLPSRFDAKQTNAAMTRRIGRGMSIMARAQEMPKG
jgi:hypothetical protein